MTRGVMVFFFLPSGESRADSAAVDPVLVTVYTISGPGLYRIFFSIHRCEKNPLHRVRPLPFVLVAVLACANAQHSRGTDHAALKCAAHADDGVDLVVCDARQQPPQQHPLYEPALHISTYTNSTAGIVPVGGRVAAGSNLDASAHPSQRGARHRHV